MNPDEMAPLFIPLKKEYYDAFDRGEKTDEMRLYGPRWNEKTCPPGRLVIISKGYGRQQRRRGLITAFNKFDARGYDEAAQAAVIACYGTLDKPIAHITIEILPKKKWPDCLCTFAQHMVGDGCYECR